VKTKNSDRQFLGKIFSTLAVVVMALVVFAWRGAEAVHLGSSPDTPEGTPIGNQASATYSDPEGAPQQTFSNAVLTYVAAVYDVDLATDDQEKFSSVGGTAYFPYTVANTGNATDDILITLTTNSDESIAFEEASTSPADDYEFSTTTIFEDANCDGNVLGEATLATSVGTDINTTFLNVLAGQSVCFVVGVTSPAGAAPPGAQNGEIEGLKVDADSQGDSTVGAGAFDTNDARVVVTDNAVLTITKGVDDPIGSASPASTHTFTLNYSNTGNNPADLVTITDVIPSGFVYVSGSGLWSGSTSALGDPSFGDTSAPAGSVADDAGVSGVAYNEASGTITIVIGSVPGGASGSISFQVTVGTTTTAPIFPPDPAITNVATYAYDSDSSGSIDVAGQQTNGSSVEIVLDSGVTVTDPGVQSNEPQGGVVDFCNTITNTGTGSDIFNLTIGVDTFPAGTTFQFFKADAVCNVLGPLIDTNFPDDSIPDTGLLASGSSVKVVLRAVLPTGADACPGADCEVLKTATSTLDDTSPASGNDTDVLDGITPNSVDLTNNSAVDTPDNPQTVVVSDFGQGANTGHTPEASPITTKSTDPGVGTYYKLIVKNTGANADTFLLDKGIAFNTIPAMGALPSGWTVDFFHSSLTSLPGVAMSTGTAETCSDDPSGATNADSGLIFTTSVIPGPGCQTIYALVTPPADAAPTIAVTIPAGVSPTTSPSTPPPPAGHWHVHFYVSSPTSGTLDEKHDALDIHPQRQLSLTLNQTSQVFPGGFVVYQHLLANVGNVDEPSILLFTTDDEATGTLNVTDIGWQSLVYLEDDGAPGLSGGDILLGADSGPITSISLTPAGTAGATVTLWVKVISPLGAFPPAQNVTVLTAQPNGETCSPVPAPSPGGGTGGTGVGTYPASTSDPDYGTVGTADGGITDVTCIENTDTSEVLSGTLLLTKEQAIDSDCDGDAPVMPYTQFAIGTPTAPDPNATPSTLSGVADGPCICYRVVGENFGNVPIDDVVLDDTVPANTHLAALPTYTAPTGTVTLLSPLPGSVAGTAVTTDTLPATAGGYDGLLSAETLTLEYCVEIE
jgi:uncharacterized repeat protein (TIGR01451 family)